MKKYITLILIGILIFGCSDGDNSTNDQLTGKWNWNESSGGIDGRVENPTTTGKIIVLEFTESTIKTYENGLLKAEVNYQIQLQNSILGGQREMIITGTGQNEFRRSYEIESNNLYLNDECYDCFQSKYTKQ